VKECLVGVIAMDSLAWLNETSAAGFKLMKNMSAPLWSLPSKHTLSVRVYMPGKSACDKMTQLLQKAKHEKAKQVQNEDNEESEDKSAGPSKSSRMSAKQRWELVRRNLGDGGRAFKVPLLVSPKLNHTLNLGRARGALTRVLGLLPRPWSPLARYP
jgi:hypothetical protein